MYDTTNAIKCNKKFTNEIMQISIQTKKTGNKRRCDNEVNYEQNVRGFLYWHFVYQNPMLTKYMTFLLTIYFNNDRMELPNNITI